MSSNPPNPNPAPPSDAQLRADLQAERDKNAKLTAEARGYLTSARSEWERAENAQAALREMAGAPPRNTAPEPFRRLSTEGIALDATTQEQLLDEGTRSRAREEFNEGAQELERRRLADQYRLEQKIALNIFRQNNPTIAADEEGFAAAITKAQIRAMKQGMKNLDPVSMLNMGVAIYNEGRTAPPVIPFTEGAGMPGGPNVAPRPAGPKPPSLWEKLYGAKDVVDESHEGWSLDGMTEAYLDRKNLELVKEGFRSSIGQVMGQIQEAQSRQKPAA